MSETERVHEPSPIRLFKAREEGDVARSAELSRSLILSSMLGSIFVFAGTIQEIVTEKIRACIAGVKVKLADFSVQSQTEGWFDLYFPFLFFLVSITCIGLLVWHFQSPLTPRIQKVNPDVSRVSPGSWMCRIFSMDSLSRATIGLISFVALATIAVLILFNQSHSVVGVAAFDSGKGIQFAGSFLRNVFVASGVVLIVLGFADYVRERWKLASRLKMTDQERRDEARETEMNPQVRRQILR